MGKLQRDPVGWMPICSSDTLESTLEHSFQLIQRNMFCFFCFFFFVCVFPGDLCTGITGITWKAWMALIRNTNLKVAGPAIFTLHEAFWCHRHYPTNLLVWADLCFIRKIGHKCREEELLVSEYFLELVLLFLK